MLTGARLLSHSATLQVNTQARTKNKITLALSSVEEFRDFLNMFAEFYNNLGKNIR